MVACVRRGRGRTKLLKRAPPLQKRKPAAGAPLPSFAHVKHRVPWTIKALPGCVVRVAWAPRALMQRRESAEAQHASCSQSWALRNRHTGHRGRRAAAAGARHCVRAARPLRAGRLPPLLGGLADCAHRRRSLLLLVVCSCSGARSPACARIYFSNVQRALTRAPQGPEHAAFCSLEAAIAGASAETGVDAELLRLVAALALAQDATPQTDDNGDVAAPLRGTVADVSSLRAPGDGATGNSPPEPPLVAAFAALLRLAGEARLGRDATSLARLAAIVNGNAHGLGAPRNVDGSGSADVAAGLFPFLSMFNHSCAPRAVFAAAAPGGVMAVRALVACAAGEELTVSYINLYESRASRRAATLATKGFACACERCAAPLAGSFDRRLQGAACRCGDVFIPDEGAPADPLGWRCAGCGCAVRGAWHARAVCGASQNVCANRKHDGGTGAAAASAAAAELDAAMRAYVERGHGAAEPLLAALLSRHGKTLSEHHVTLFDARTPALNCARAPTLRRRSRTAPPSLLALRARWDHALPRRRPTSTRVWVTCTRSAQMRPAPRRCASRCAPSRATLSHARRRRERFALDRTIPPRPPWRRSQLHVADRERPG